VFGELLSTNVYIIIIIIIINIISVVDNGLVTSSSQFFKFT